MYDYITPQKLLDALAFLKANNPLYADIEVNQEWLDKAIANDAELYECLVEQENDSNEQTNNTAQPTLDSPNHFTSADSPAADVANVDSPASECPVIANVDSPAAECPAVANVDSPAAECPAVANVDSPAAECPAVANVDSPAAECLAVANVDSPAAECPVIASVIVMLALSHHRYLTTAL